MKWLEYPNINKEPKKVFKMLFHRFPGMIMLRLSPTFLPSTSPPLLLLFEKAGVHIPSISGFR